MQWVLVHYLSMCLQNEDSVKKETVWHETHGRAYACRRVRPELPRPAQVATAGDSVVKDWGSMSDTWVATDGLDRRIATH